MEPGHEDREYGRPQGVGRLGLAASMEPGHEDREYKDLTKREAAAVEPQWSPVMKTGNTLGDPHTRPGKMRLNGARS